MTKINQLCTKTQNPMLVKKMYVCMSKLGCFGQFRVKNGPKTYTLPHSSRTKPTNSLIFCMKVGVSLTGR